MSLVRRAAAISTFHELRSSSPKMIVCPAFSSSMTECHAKHGGTTFRCRATTAWLIPFSSIFQQHFSLLLITGDSPVGKECSVCCKVA